VRRGRPSPDAAARRLPSFRQFVDDALFHPRWGYYAAGAVRFGLGGHYDTYPMALSPLFGRMVAAHAERVWRAGGRPRRFELCEIGAGNGQLAVDVVVAVEAAAQAGAGRRRFAESFCYRILERSPALAARQRERLGPLAARVAWSRGDLVRGVPRGAPFAPCGLVFGNEVLDCFAPERVVPRADGSVGVTFVEPRLGGRPLSRAALARAMAGARTRRRVRFREVVLPLGTVRGLEAFVRRHYPELFVPGRARLPYFACPQIEPFLAHAARLYERAEAILIDYGDTRDFHLRAPERRRLVAGPPRSGASVYRDPGRDDVTVMVDFSVVRTAARRAGWRVVAYGPQRLLRRGTGVRLDRRAADLIARSRALGWLLGALGADPESDWRAGALTWSRGGRRESLAASARRDVAEFLGRRPSPFRLIHLRRGW
jgi:SAM-dependent MidA family methyltransferase